MLTSGAAFLYISAISVIDSFIEAAAKTESSVAASAGAAATSSAQTAARNENFFIKNPLL